MGHWNGQPEIQWKSEPTCGEPLHAEVLRGPGRAEVEDGAEPSTAQQGKEKRQREAATEGHLVTEKTEGTCFRNGHRG